MSQTTRPAAALLGYLGGINSSRAKREAAQRNGCQGGRPTLPKPCLVCQELTTDRAKRCKPVCNKHAFE